MKKLVGLVLVLLLAFACTSASAQDITREMTLEQCIGEEGFVFPEEIEWYTPIDEVIAWLPLSETMTPGDEAFDARKYTELPDNSQVTLTPDILYPRSRFFRCCVLFGNKRI